MWVSLEHQKKHPYTTLVCGTGRCTIRVLVLRVVGVCGDTFLWRRSPDIDDRDISGGESRESTRDFIENGPVDKFSDNKHGVTPPPFDELGDLSNDSLDQNEQSVPDSSGTDSNTDSDGYSNDGDFLECSASDN
ncbi:hypothetical protein QAD02_007396 [Eretmocerus hayati]|uniref:Uncharacterized protein n=1 Tax=Eretmocerus hayati TaxID=131215 RepID=A0ACC2N5Y5_9HYME|nr:hypothetical protein QAD02_007396 [Eretmocerus hayati]